MRAWISLTVALALAAVVPAAAQYGAGTTPQGTPATMGTPSAMIPSPDVMSQGTLVDYHAATGGYPAMATLRFDWGGTPLLGTYEIRSGDRWMLNGQRVNWAQVSQGTTIPVPSGAYLRDLTFGGAMGVGTVVDVDHQLNQLVVRLPSSQVRTLRYAPNAIFIRDGKVTPLSKLDRSDNVVFEVPPSGNQVALVSDLGSGGTLATVTQVGDNSITVNYTKDNRTVTRSYPLSSDARFFAAGQPIVADNFANAFRTGQQVWIYGPEDHPRFVATDVTRGYEAALVEPPCAPATTASATGEGMETAEAPITETPSTTAEQPTTETTTTTTVASTDMMAPPFNQGTVVSYQPATADMPGLVTMRFDWNGQPLTGTFQVSDTSQWMSPQGQPVDFTQLQPGTEISVPANARLANLTFGGTSGIGTITAIDRNANTMTVRLPTGELRTIRYSPQAVLLQNGQVAMLSDLTPGQTVMFEVVPGQNQVGLISPVQQGTRATVAQVNDSSITVRMVQNGQTVTQTYPFTENIRYYNRGQLINAADVQTTLTPGQTVWIYGPTESPDLIASNVQTGFEAAVVTPVTPAPTVATIPPAPSPAVAGSRQTPPRPRRVIRGRW